MKKLLCSLILLLCTTAVSASAETAIEARADFENNRIVVTGVTEPSTEIPVMLFRDFGTAVLTPDNIELYAEHVTSATSDASGNVPETSLAMIPTGAWFKLFAGDAALSGTGIAVYYPTQAEFDAAKLAVNGAATDTMSGVLAVHGKALGVDLSCREYSDYTEEFCAALAQKKPSGGWTYISDAAQPVTFQKDFEAVKAVYNRYVEALNSINSATRETLTGVLGSYNDILGLTLSGKYATYSSEINRSLATVQYESLEAFKTAFNNAVTNYTPPGSHISGSSGGSSFGGGTVGVEITPNPVNPQLLGFADLSSVQWAAESINRLAAAGVVSGTGNNMFTPNGFVTREQFVKMILLALDISADGGNAQFTDVSASDWYYSYVISASELGIVKGKDNGSFGVGEYVTREDMVTIAARAIKAANAVLPTAITVNYTDEADISAYAKEAANALGNAGIITGMPDGSFMPKDFSTRAQAAVMLDRLMQITRG